MPRIFTCMLACTLFLSGCDTALEKSDYVGGFVTKNGGCAKKGKTSVNYKNKKIEVRFFCFLKECANMSGDMQAAGYFHLKGQGASYIKGRVFNNEAKGEWFLNIKNENCSGHWAALKS